MSTKVECSIIGDIAIIIIGHYMNMTTCSAAKKLFSELHDTSPYLTDL